MNGKIIDGKYYADKILTDLYDKVKKINKDLSIVPTLAIILVGNDSASLVYINNKIKAAKKININAFKIIFDENVALDEVLANIMKLNDDKNISGIIVQLPLPKHLNAEILLSAIHPDKDVDGFHPLNSGKLYSGFTDCFVPATALGCLYLIKQYISNLSGKNAVIIGRSRIVGRPVAALLLRENCTITICHSTTNNLSEITSRADVIVTAVGKAKSFTENYFNQNSIIIDVGITKDNIDGKLYGDVDFERVVNNVQYITPVPKGVGPMTVVMLLNNVIDACVKQHKLT
ncbi:MAG: bifunctional 5,10-methylenetetrahydrofolate dehydrogenase/5,10-methenyltetrahydrofolate cyclohydrolase [Rickettsiaceae bacterium]